MPKIEVTDISETQPDYVDIVRKYAKILYETVHESGDDCPEGPIYLAFQGHMSLVAFNSIRDACLALGVLRRGRFEHTLTAVPGLARACGLAD